MTSAAPMALAPAAPPRHTPAARAQAPRNTRVAAQFSGVVSRSSSPPRNARECRTGPCNPGMPTSAGPEREQREKYRRGFVHVQTATRATRHSSQQPTPCIPMTSSSDDAGNTTPAAPSPAASAPRRFPPGATPTPGRRARQHLAFEGDAALETQRQALRRIRQQLRVRPRQFAREVESRASPEFRAGGCAPTKLISVQIETPCERLRAAANSPSSSATSLHSRLVPPAPHGAERRQCDEHGQQQHHDRPDIQETCAATEAMSQSP